MNPHINEEQLRRLNDLVIKAPINSYDLLGRVVDAIRAEPARLDMRGWVVAAPYGDWYYEVDPSQLPACGTVACAAGWAGFILGYAFMPSGIMDIITGTYTGWRGLWSDLYSGIFVNDELTNQPPSKALAEDVARRLDEFREKYKTDLMLVVHQPQPPLRQQIEVAIAQQKKYVAAIRGFDDDDGE